MVFGYFYGTFYLEEGDEPGYSYCMHFVVEYVKHKGENKYYLYTEEYALFVNENIKL